MHINETQNNVSYVSAEMKYRFVNNASVYCPLINYKINRIMQKQSRNYVPEGTFRNMFSIGDTNGTFWMNHFNTPFYRWYIYIQAFNGKEWGGDDVQWTIDATLNVENPWTLNMAPFFRTDVENY